MTVIPGGTSTGSKRASALFGTCPGPRTYQRASGCLVWDAEGNRYTDFMMALGAVGLGYADRRVTAAATAAIEAGGVGPLPSHLEEELAVVLCEVLPGCEQVRFLKTGAEAVLAALRIARVYTGRERVLTCGYHGWLDWCSTAGGVPRGVQALRSEIPFNDPDAARRAVRREAHRLAAVVVEPLIEGAPDRAWLEALREETHRTGALLIFDEIKTAFRIAVGGAAETHGVTPDLMVVGKALANGFPLAAVAGPSRVMSRAADTWISSTLASEAVALAVAKAVIETYRRDSVCAHLDRVGRRWWQGLNRLVGEFPQTLTSVRGVPQMCFATFPSERTSERLASECAKRGLLLKRTAYNFVSWAHTDEVVDAALSTLQDALGAC